MFEKYRIGTPPAPLDAQPYSGRMPVSAHAIIAEIRARIPAVGKKKAHKLLFYAQGHHLGWFGVPLFRETISAWDMGPVVGEVWYAEDRGEVPDIVDELGEAELNTIGYVISRYGNLSGNDLQHLSHSQEPWQRANARRQPGGRARIEPEWMAEFFAGESDDEDGIVLDSDAVAEFLKASRERPPPTGGEDETPKLRAMLADLQARRAASG